MGAGEPGWRRRKPVAEKLPIGEWEWVVGWVGGGWDGMGMSGMGWVGGG